MSGWAFYALGDPAPQGSKTPVRNKDRQIVGSRESSKKIKPWRECVKAAAPGGPLLDGPVIIRVVFTLKRPTSARKIDHIPYRTPDLDKLLRGLLDPVTQVGLLADDARVAEVSRLAKVWPGYDPEALDVPGVVIAAWEMKPEVAFWEERVESLFYEALDRRRDQVAADSGEGAIPLDVSATLFDTT